MTISALAEVGTARGEPRYLAAAERAAELLWAKRRTSPGELRRVYLNGRATQPGLQEDHAFLARPWELRLQACSNALCLPPETRVLHVPINAD